FFFSSRRRHTRFSRDWSSDVCSSDLLLRIGQPITTNFFVVSGSTRNLCRALSTAPSTIQNALSSPKQLTLKSLKPRRCSRKKESPNLFFLVTGKKFWR